MEQVNEMRSFRRVFTLMETLPALMLYKAQMKLATKVSISMVLGLGALVKIGIAMFLYGAPSKQALGL
uniref:Uncharacterized protein n=1 Tax=Fusarium oxysporum (strain Fo5176) TaxID=660025 RepID=A0A0D2YAK6_FUSOF